MGPRLRVNGKLVTSQGLSSGSEVLALAGNRCLEALPAQGLTTGSDVGGHTLDVPAGSDGRAAAADAISGDWIVYPGSAPDISC